MPVNATRIFTAADQQHFAAMSGDYNPIHLDSKKARRTQAGAQVVHGLNLLLWSLDELASQGFTARKISTLRAQFMKFVYLGEIVRLVVRERSADEIEIQIVAEGLARSKFIVGFGERIACSNFGPIGEAIENSPQEGPLAVAIEDMAEQSGYFPLQGRLAPAQSLYPGLCDWITPETVAALGATTHLVGMVYPGLHSVFSGLSVKLCDAMPSAALAFRVRSVHSRFRTVDHLVWGGGIEGSLATLVRRPPTPQLSFTALQEFVRPDEFAGAHALVVGGSRGLGELTAKIIAAGGGRTTITYNVGEAEAHAVAEEIRSRGGNCSVMHFDAASPPAQPVISAAPEFTHAYYYATSGIFRSQEKAFNRHRFDAFVSIYVDGFFSLCEVLAASGGAKSIFYPSTAFVTSRPRGMTEYVMAKAAGELLCEEIGTTMPTLRTISERLPRLLTDQTASIVPIKTVPAMDAILPIIRRLHARDIAGLA